MTRVMRPTEFQYRLSDEGHVVLGQLTSEETLEFEVLSRQERDGLMDLHSELRLLDLYVKCNGQAARPQHELRTAASPPLAARRGCTKTMARRQLTRSIAMVMIVGVICAGLAAIALLAE